MSWIPMKCLFVALALFVAVDVALFSLNATLLIREVIPYLFDSPHSLIEPELPSPSQEEQLLMNSGPNVVTICCLPAAACRTGNCLFLLASLVGIGMKNNMTVYLPPGSFDGLFKMFKLNAIRKLHKMESYNEIRMLKHDTLEQQCDPRLNSIGAWNENIAINGYIQCFAYFDSISGFLRQELQLNDNLQKAAVTELNSSQRGKDGTNVGVHVRRGDFVVERVRQFGFAAAPRTYFEKAMDHFRKKLPNVSFHVASDDMGWVKANIKGPDVMYSVGSSAEEDFAMLVNCDHIIISSGTFSWWAAWLNPGTTIYYNGYPRPDSILWNMFSLSEYYYPHWIGMS